MITRYGYITDDLDKLSLEDLEAILIDLDKDSYIDDWERWNLMSDYMSARPLQYGSQRHGSRP